MTDTSNTQNAIAPEFTEINDTSVTIRGKVTRQLADQLAKLQKPGENPSDPALNLLYDHFGLKRPIKETPAQKRKREAEEEKARLANIEKENAELKRQLEELKAAQAQAAKPAEAKTAPAQPAKPAQAQASKGNQRR